MVQRVLTTDRIKTGELFPIIDDLAVTQDYMHGQMGILKSKIDLEKFVDPPLRQRGRGPIGVWPGGVPRS